MLTHVIFLCSRAIGCSDVGRLSHIRWGLELRSQSARCRATMCKPCRSTAVSTISQANNRVSLASVRLAPRLIATTALSYCQAWAQDNK